MYPYTPLTEDEVANLTLKYATTPAQVIAIARAATYDMLKQELLDRLSYGPEHTFSDADLSPDGLDGVLPVDFDD